MSVTEYNVSRGINTRVISTLNTIGYLHITFTQTKAANKYINFFIQIEGRGKSGGTYTPPIVIASSDNTGMVMTTTSSYTDTSSCSGQFNITPFYEVLVSVITTIEGTVSYSLSYRS